ncbi:MAG: UPF0104 family protein [Thainema sp.]
MPSAVQQFKRLISATKPYLRWVIAGFTIFFVLSTLHQNWQEVTTLEISQAGWLALFVAFGVILFALIWSGWVWSWIFLDFNQLVGGTWSVPVYVKTNLAKYIPGNVWHFYGRITAAKAVGIPLGTSMLSVLFEPMLMAAAALLVASSIHASKIGLWYLVSIGILVGLHPKIVNHVLFYLKRVKERKSPIQGDFDNFIRLHRYPWRPLLGEVGFIVLRGVGFCLIFISLYSVEWDQFPVLLASFSLAWLVGFIVPGAPGGIGVFEAISIWLLRPIFPIGTILGAIALHRFISVMAEICGAGIVFLDEYWNDRTTQISSQIPINPIKRPDLSAESPDSDNPNRPLP